MLRATLALLLLTACGGDDEAPADPAQSAYCLNVRKAWLMNKQQADQYTNLTNTVGNGRPDPNILAEWRNRMDAIWAQNPECFR